MIVDEPRRREDVALPDALPCVQCAECGWLCCGMHASCVADTVYSITHYIAPCALRVMVKAVCARVCCLSSIFIAQGGTAMSPCPRR